MKSLAAFKRELTIGSKWAAVWFDKHGNKVELGIREVISKNTVNVIFKTDENKESYLYLDQKNIRFEFPGDNEVLVYSRGCKINDIPESLVLIYKKVS